MPQAEKRDVESGGRERKGERVREGVGRATSREEEKRREGREAEEGDGPRSPAL